MRELKNILYIEDEPDIREITKLSLGLVGGFSVRECSGGAEALAILHDELKPDLIIIDVMMPGLDGPATMSRLKQNPDMADIPVIFMTAKVFTNELKSYHEMGVIGVISKPFDPMSLHETVQKLWEGSFCQEKSLS